MNKYLEVSRFFYILGLTLTPFVVNPFSLGPYNLSKLYFLAIVIFLSFIFYLFSEQKKFFLPNVWFSILIILEFGSQNLSLNFFPRYSEHVYVSLVLYFVVFLAINLFKKFDLEKIIFTSSFFVVFPSLIDIFNFSNRISGTLGQPNFLGIFLTISLLIILKSFDDLKQRFNKNFLFLYMAIILIMIFKTASLSAFFSLVIGSIYIFPKVKFLNKNVLLLFTLVTLLIATLFGSVFISKFVDMYNQAITPDRTIISDSFLIRKELWNETFSILLANPKGFITGLGANQFDFYFEKQREFKFQGLSEENLIFDKPHNYLLEILFSYGAIYFVILFFLIYKIVKQNSEIRYLIFPILFFLVFNWADIVLKIILFLIIFLNLEKSEHESNSIFKIVSFLLFFTILVNFSNLFYNDLKFYLGDQNFIFSYTRQEITQLKVKSPLTLLSSLEYLGAEEKRKIFDFLIKNFPNNQAILFNLNILF